ncbi:hypothetical protein [Shewanella sp. GD03713]|uniref:hypothetical protein n=1 Tax=Shewanella sp. GD03713 TaxID=2975372 RepID=UPI00244C08E2|nr:hypothetical protein [Shewanella sp. GD03713]MDH1472608.1 hypothetical protein [Shewanella sp. GD03713]
MKTWILVSWLVAPVIFLLAAQNLKDEFTIELNGLGVGIELVLKDPLGDRKLACYEEYTVTLRENYEDEKDLSYIHRQSDIAFEKCVLKAYTIPAELHRTMSEANIVPVNYTIPYEVLKWLQQVETPTKQEDPCISATIELIKMCPTLLQPYVKIKES